MPTGPGPFRAPAPGTPWPTQLAPQATAAAVAAQTQAEVPTGEQELTPSGDWESLGASRPARGLILAGDGALYVRTNRELQWSAGVGAPWTSVPLPQGAQLERLVVHPADPRVLYVAGDGGLYRSRNGGGHWELVLPTQGAIAGLAGSPPDRDLVYVVLLERASFQFLRSRDGGTTWDRRQALPPGNSCTWNVALLVVHPTDAQRVFRTAGCWAGRSFVQPDFSGALSQSTDQGASWATLFRPPRVVATRLVGGRGSAPGRFYLVAQEPFASGGRAQLYRSDDDGSTWAEVWTVERRADAATTEGVAIYGLAYDPARPDRVYVGLRHAANGVQVSADGGVTWTDLGLADRGPLQDLVLSDDGERLYAATELGVWWRRVPSDASNQRP